ncbi:hypothetical protein MTBBW1_2400009 [Desulfamplus magnetovallimortis]|uniref:Uncharacterized protein n=1 Tax=Desulfamplus magnetovallimortis TaxID=1246637 RepID=A0A1W1HEF4_9BACT|nr:hypothetical protein MTBBW1_2400009 [Desulfamplus magnetovallimortis]
MNSVRIIMTDSFKIKVKALKIPFFKGFTSEKCKVLLDEMKDARLSYKKSITIAR